MLPVSSSANNATRGKNLYAFPKLKSQFVQFDIYQTSTYLHVVAMNYNATQVQVLNIDREASDISLNFEKVNLCSIDEINQRLDKLKQMDSTYKKVCTACAIVGIIQFSDENDFYLYVVTEKEKVGSINRSVIYTIKHVKLIQISAEDDGNAAQNSSSRGISKTKNKHLSTSPSSKRHINKKHNTNNDSNHVVNMKKKLFLQLDLTKEFYFSYTYDITNTLQNNMIFGGNQIINASSSNHKQKDVKIPHTTTVNKSNNNNNNHSNINNNSNKHHQNKSKKLKKIKKCNEYFVWNSYLLEELVGALGTFASPWITPIIHGYFSQRTLLLDNRKLRMTLIARRSRHFAGPRYLKRGADIQGRVANEVETEQIIGEEPLMTEHGLYTSMVQVRGSIPLHWCHENLSFPKPDFLLWKTDPTYKAASLHFDNLARRYPEPLVSLNLIKQEETGRPKETLLFDEYTKCIQYLNAQRQQTMSQHGTRVHQKDEGTRYVNNKALGRTKPIAYITFDFLKCARSPNQNVLDAMSEITASILNTTGFFRTLAPLSSVDARIKNNMVSLQHLRYGIEQQGTLRTNCIDCLDRTNVAQFCLGRNCLEAQMKALNVDITNSVSEYALVWQELMKMYAEHGNCMGNQYGGSGAMHSLALVKTAASNTSGNTSSSSNNNKTFQTPNVKGDKHLLLRSPSRSPIRSVFNMLPRASSNNISVTKSSSNKNTSPNDIEIDTSRHDDNKSITDNNDNNDKNGDYTSFSSQFRSPSTASVDDDESSKKAIQWLEEKKASRGSGNGGSMGTLRHALFGSRKNVNKKDETHVEEDANKRLVHGAPTTPPVSPLQRPSTSTQNHHHHGHQEVTLTGGAKNALVAVTRYISNNFSDSDKQRSLDIFLGTYDDNNGYTGSKLDVERAASTSGGSMFTIARQVFTEFDQQKYDDDDSNNRGSSSDRHCTNIKSINNSSKVEYDCNTITHFDDEFDSPFGKSIVNNLMEAPEEFTEYMMEEEYTALNLAPAADKDSTKANNAPKDINNKVATADTYNKWYNSWLSTTSNGLDFVLHKMTKEKGNGNVLSAINTRSPANNANDNVDELNTLFRQHVYDKYVSTEKESEAMYIYYTHLQK